MYKLPNVVISNLESTAYQFKKNDIQSSYKKISSGYRHCDYCTIKTIDAFSYACARMPATFNAISFVLEKFIQKTCITNFNTVLDIGAGSGALACALSNFNINFNSYTAVEKSSDMISIMKIITNNMFDNIQYTNFDAENFLKENTEQREYENIFFVYSLNEMQKKEKIITNAIKCAKEFIFIIEPGTPEGFKNILLCKKIASNLNCNVIAPCASNTCQLSPGDWCHFCVRLERSPLHTFIKNASLNYEDEKFCYLIIEKEHTHLSNDTIVKRPIKKSGHTIFDVCTKDGLQRKVISNKKLKQKFQWGDELHINNDLKGKK